MIEKQNPEDEGSTVQEAAAKIGNAVEEKAGHVAREAAECGRTMLDQQKERVAEELESLARAIRSAATSLSRENNAASASLVEKGAEAAERLSRSLRGRNARDLAQDAASFARQHPLAVAAGGLLAGAVLGRIVGLGWSIEARKTGPEAA